MNQKCHAAGRHFCPKSGSPPLSLGSWAQTTMQVTKRQRAAGRPLTDWLSWNHNRSGSTLLQLASDLLPGHRRLIRENRTQLRIGSFSTFDALYDMLTMWYKYVFLLLGEQLPKQSVKGGQDKRKKSERLDVSDLTVTVVGHIHAFVFLSGRTYPAFCIS